MQQYLVGRGTLDQGEALVGHEALRDTMKDLGLDLIGSLIPAIIGYFELRRQKRVLHICTLKRKQILLLKL